jgi:hypothetical protein
MASIDRGRMQGGRDDVDRVGLADSSLDVARGPDMPST